MMRVCSYIKYRKADNMKSSKDLLLGNKVTILMNSCDLYEDVWEPCLNLFKVQWPSCPYDFVINSETKHYSGSFSNAKTICPGTTSLTWSERLKYVLERINSPYVFFTLEDYFPLEQINDAIFQKAVKIMDNNTNVGVICLSHTDRVNINTGEYEDEDFYSRVIDPKCMIWCRMNLYRCEYLLKLLKMHETIWEFEAYAAYRARKLDYLVLQQNNNNRECFTFKVKIEDGYGITLRKWLPKNVELFKKHNIYVNFENLGFFVDDLLKKKKVDSIAKLSFKEKLYLLKKIPQKFKKKLRKKIRIFKSKH